MNHSLFLTQLHIFQLEEYNPTRFLSWWFTHPLVYRLDFTKKPLRFTTKIKLLLFLSYLLFVCLSLISILTDHFYLAFVCLLVFIFLPFIYLFLSLAILKPYELINKHLTILRTRQRLQQIPALTTIGITGSFGKTSTKNILFHLLSATQPTVKTPNSYNTIFGIAKAVNLEIIFKTKYFICEMGAYHPGDISTLCQECPPQYAIITAIGSQHLERFRSIDNIVRTKFEIMTNITPRHGLVNLDNPHIQKQLAKKDYQKLLTYSLTNPDATFFVSRYRLTSKGTVFTLRYQKRQYHFSTNLFGTSHLYNLTAAISMAIMLKIPIPTIQRVVQHLPQNPHRTEFKSINRATLIDDAYSSNEVGFARIIQDLSQLKGKKALITPGIVELGPTSNQIHHHLGHLAKHTFDTIVLVGHSSRTTSFARGAKPHRIIYIDSSHSAIAATIDKLSHAHQFILLENDLPENY